MLISQISSKSRRRCHDRPRIADLGRYVSSNGYVDLPCPDCGPERRSTANQRRKVLRVWRGADDFMTWYCARCGTAAVASGAKGASRSRCLCGRPAGDGQTSGRRAARPTKQGSLALASAATDPRQHRRNLFAGGARLHRAAPGHARISPGARRIPASDDRRLRHSNRTGARRSLDLRQRRSRRASHPLLPDGAARMAIRQRSWSATPSARRSCSRR